MFNYSSIIVPFIPCFVLILIPIPIFFPEVFRAIIFIPEASGIITAIAIIECSPFIGRCRYSWVIIAERVQHKLTVTFMLKACPGSKNFSVTSIPPY